MRLPQRRLKYRRDPSSPYDTVAAFVGDDRVGQIDWCKGRYHVVIDGYGHLGGYKSEATAKAVLRTYERRFPLARARRRAAAARPA
jgi:hypothetical protein